MGRSGSEPAGWAACASALRGVRSMRPPAGVARRADATETAHVRVGWIAEMDRLRDSGRLYLFAPLCLALGILVYFELPHEPPAALLASVALGLGWVGRHTVLGRVAALLVVGVSLPALHAALLGDLPRTLPDSPRRIAGVLERVEGREGDGTRIVLRVSQGVLGAERLQLTMRDDADLPPGTAVTVVAALSYAPGPVLPGQYDHARRLYFEGVDAIGVVIAGPYREAVRPIGPVDRMRRAIAAVRLAIAARIGAVLDGQTGALATALLTGLRGDLSAETLEDMRSSGLAHVLAISGMHMGLFCTSLFLALRAAFALVGATGVRLPAKKLAAAGALLGGTFYLLISGGQIATQRAYIMTAIVCLAVLLDRPALTLRNVATAALVVLALSPESLMGASFQMSFAATIALIAVYERWNARSIASETILAIPGQPAERPLRDLAHRRVGNGALCELPLQPRRHLRARGEPCGNAFRDDARHAGRAGEPDRHAVRTGDRPAHRHGLGPRRAPRRRQHRRILAQCDAGRAEPGTGGARPRVSRPLRPRDRAGQDGPLRQRAMSRRCARPAPRARGSSPHRRRERPRPSPSSRLPVRRTSSAGASRVSPKHDGRSGKPIAPRRRVRSTTSATATPSDASASPVSDA